MATQTDFIDIGVRVKLERDLLDYQLIGNVTVHFPGGKMITFNRSSGSFHFIDGKEVHSTIRNEMDGLLLGVSRKISKEVEYVGGITTGDIKAQE